MSPVTAGSIMVVTETIFRILMAVSILVDFLARLKAGIDPADIKPTPREVLEQRARDYVDRMVADAAGDLRTRGGASMPPDPVVGPDPP